ncbi:MAG: MobA/MobL family protein [Methylococcaceae bacterium]|nr:MobA/MobL family protein [Methylococcaceae bacterium]
MATYHLTAKIGQKGKAQPHAAYIAREGKYSGSNRYEDLEATDYGNMPAWAEHNPAEFWQAADENERANGSTYRELEIALPRELTPPQRLELVHEFIAQELGENHAYQFAIHTPKAALEKGEQPHAHIMYSERIRDGIERDPEQYFKRYNAKNPDKGGAKKYRRGNGMAEVKAELSEQRERWANLQNYHLEKHGHNERVDHRSLKDQGIIEREPEKHLGGAGVRNTTAKNNLLELRAATIENVQAQTEAAPLVAEFKKQTSTLDIATNAAEKLKNKLAERAQAKAKAQAAANAEAQQQDQARRIEQNKIEAAQKLAQLQQTEREATKPAPEQPKKPKSKDHDWER